MPGQLAASLGRAAPDAPGYCARLGQSRRDRGRRLSRVFRLFIRARRAARTGYDPLLASPDNVENDYYRFLKYPRG
jgi:hypothetical protein